MNDEKPNHQGGGSIDRAVDSYQRIFNNLMNLDLLNVNGTLSAEQDEKAKQIQTSKQAKGHFFSMGYLQKYKDAVDQDEDLKNKQIEAMDSIDYFNKKYIAKDKIKKTVKISGSFFKVRSQGGASGKDIDELNKFYKRSLVTMFIVMAHSYIAVNFLYDARFVTQRRLPRVYGSLPWAVYPLAALGSIVYMFTENTRIMGQLDRKYTPLWLEISNKI